jgi:hypothetical protein
MRSEVLTLGALSDWSLALTIARYRKVHGFLAPFFMMALGGLLIGAALTMPEKVVVATLVVLPLVFFVRYRISRHPVHGAFLAEIFLGGFLFRVFLGLTIYHFGLELPLGGDSMTYDWYGLELAEVWRGGVGSDYLYHSQLAAPLSTANWGILYWAAAFYYVFGHNLLLLNCVDSVIGAATAILVVKIADALFGDREISILSGLLAAFFPSIALWGSQLLKEPLLLFCLCLIVYSMQRVAICFRLRYAVYIVGALLAILALRFVIFYVMLFTLTAALIAPSRPLSPVRLIRHLAVLGIVLAGVVYLVGAQEMLKGVEQQLQLERIEMGRQDQAKGLGPTGEEVGSGFSIDVDISTPKGALGHLPVGFLYFMFGPFPWDVWNLRQVTALPEGLLWWGMFPMFLRGLWLALRHRLPESGIILVFTATLTLVTSLAMGNVGSAYRMRSQVLIFFFIFVALGYVWKKRKRLARAVARQGQPTPGPAGTGGGWRRSNYLSSG